MPVWEQNSSSLGLILDDSLIGLLYFVITLGTVIMIHSWLLNKKKYHFVRICTEIAALFTVIQAIVALQCPYEKSCKLMTNLVLDNIVVNAICGAITQGCDNLITFTRYAAVSTKISKLHKLFALSYVIIFLYLTWWPFFTIFPFFWDQNSDDAINILSDLNIINVIMYSVYDLIYTGLMIRILINRNCVQSSGTDKKFRLLILKAMIHNIISICGVTAYVLIFPLGIFLQNILIMTSLHVLFNWKIQPISFNTMSLSSSSYPVLLPHHPHHRSSRTNSQFHTSIRLSWISRGLSKRSVSNRGVNINVLSMKRNSPRFAAILPAEEAKLNLN